MLPTLKKSHLRAISVLQTASSVCETARQVWHGMSDCKNGAIYACRNFWPELGQGAGCCVYTWPSQNKCKLCSAQLGTGVGLSVACIPPYVICCQKNRAVVWKYSRQMTCLEQWWREMSEYGLVQIADVNAPAHAQPEPSQAKGRLSQGHGANVPDILV